MQSRAQLLVVLLVGGLFVGCSGGDDEPEATCTDGVWNQGEEDVDCGGPCAACVHCGCLTDSDCPLGAMCDDCLCVPHCDDGIMNGDETDVDCGGSCADCPDPCNCLTNADCPAGAVCIACICTPASQVACADLAVAADVTLSPGDDLQAASDGAIPGTVFFLEAGVHTGARVVDPPTGSSWVGQDGAILDGEDGLPNAFGGSATAVTLCNLTLRNYADNGVHFGSGERVRVDSVEVTDTGSGSGESNGAIRFDNMTDLTVVNCRFEQVSSGVLPTDCTGPVTIEHNRGLNTGRNFVQLARVTGGGIRVRYNSMERDGTYVRPGNDDVEDWISVFGVQGLADDYAQFSYNRARGHGPSASGSFIMLGDGGGQYQVAVGNIGVTPGQVGVGLSGGHSIEARENLMFSETWTDSSIAFYSADYGAGGCGDHVIADNRANWTNRDGIQNDFWSSGECTHTTSGNVFPDPSLDASIWNDWDY